MPAESEKQRAWAFGVKGEAWARKHHFDNKGPLPKYKHGTPAPRKKKRVMKANAKHVHER